ncbi:MAG: cation-transporting P-type ATPase, partial [Anaerolineae bacterium]|nr:cation-transporting P-type ATPase [Anaerolineae bacterium]
MNEKSAMDSYWSQSVANVLAMLNSAPGGLTAAEAQTRLVQSGPNTLTTRREDTPWRLLLKQFADPIVLILLAATGVSAATGEWVDAAIILAIVLGSTLLSFFQEYSAGNAAAKLREQITLKATVLRDG